jgi:hypothetical protein
MLGHFGRCGLTKSRIESGSAESSLESADTNTDSDSDSIDTGIAALGIVDQPMCRDWRSDFFHALARMPLPHRLEGIGRKLRVEQAL